MLVLLTQVTESVAACPTAHHSPKVHALATGLHQYPCHWFRSPTSWGNTSMKVATPGIPSLMLLVSIAS